PLEVATDPGALHLAALRRTLGATSPLHGVRKRGLGSGLGLLRFRDLGTVDFHPLTQYLVSHAAEAIRDAGEVTQSRREVVGDVRLGEEGARHDQDVLARVELEAEVLGRQLVDGLPGLLEA